ncbi:hypothetical protein L9F63_027079, partial [Diploptera punctata]
FHRKARTVMGLPSYSLWLNYLNCASSAPELISVVARLLSDGAIIKPLAFISTVLMAKSVEEVPLIG